MEFYPKMLFAGYMLWKLLCHNSNPHENLSLKWALTCCASHVSTLWCFCLCKTPDVFQEEWALKYLKFHEYMIKENQFFPSLNFKLTLLLLGDMFYSVKYVPLGLLLPLRIFSSFFFLILNLVFLEFFH